MDETRVILVDTNDKELGIIEKLEAHKKALLHRAISVFICNSKGQWLLQRRALNKYHSGGLWTNTSCSHPFPGESNIDAAKRRLMEEMGIHCELISLFSFIYKEKLENDLTEHELDYVFFGVTDKLPKVNIIEVMDWKYIKFSDLFKNMNSNPSDFTVWFKIIYQRVNDEISKHLVQKG